MATAVNTSTPLSRTQEEIVARLAGSDSFLDFDAEVLAPYLDYAHAKPLLADGVTEKDWASDGFPYPRTREHVLAAMRGYMEFAIGKALDHRGISAGRSVEKFTAWIWLLGDDPIAASYPNYGVPILKAVCERYDFPLPTDEHARAWFDRMALGQQCRDDCEDGCGL